MKVFNGLDELVVSAGSQLGPTDWLPVGQDRVNQFADATEDHQWIHVDPSEPPTDRSAGRLLTGC
jgi:acyl dehydratase